VITWKAPWDSTTPEFVYTIKFRHNDRDEFSTVGSICDGTDATVISSKYCSVPIATLRAAPFLYDWGAIASAKISATNIKGSSEYSEVGYGGTIEKAPDAPINLMNDAPQTNAFQVAMTWE